MRINYRRILQNHIFTNTEQKCMMLEHVWNVMAHAQKPDLVFQRNGRVHLNRRGGDLFSRLLAAEVCASAVVMVVMLDTPCSEVEWKTTGYTLHSPVSPSVPLPCVTVCHQVSIEVYYHLKDECFQFHSALKCIRCAPHVWQGRCPCDTPIPVIWRAFPPFGGNGFHVYRTVHMNQFQLNNESGW